MPLFNFKHIKKPSALGSVRRQLMLILVILAVVFVSVQFVILATLGTKGVEIAKVRQEMDQLRIENDHIRSEIDKAKTLANIEDGVTQIQNARPTNVEKVTAPEPTAGVVGYQR